MAKLVDLLVRLVTLLWAMLGSGIAFVRKWHELMSLPIAVVLWYASPMFIRWLDPTAAVFDSGVLQKFFFAVIGLLIGNFCSWILIKLTFPKLYLFLDDHFEKMFGAHSFRGDNVSDRDKMYYLTSFQKCALTLLLYTLYLLCFVLLVMAL